MENTLRLVLLALLIALPGYANAEDGDDGLDVTMTVMDEQEGAEEEAFFNEIELPDVIPEKARASAGVGTAAANEARRQVSETARENAKQGLDRGDRDNRGQPPVNPPTP